MGASLLRFRRRRLRLLSRLRSPPSRLVHIVLLDDLLQAELLVVLEGQSRLGEIGQIGNTAVEAIDGAVDRRLLALLRRELALKASTMPCW